MSDVNAQIKIAVDAAQAQAELKALQAQITALNASMASQRKAKGFDLGMGNAAGQITQIQTAASALNKDLQRMSRGFGSSFGTLRNSIKGVGPEMELARRNAAALGTQYTVLGRQANGAMAAFKGGQLAGFNSELAVMQQRVAIGIQGLNQMGTAALNWGKNIQWAGRQLMVGLTIPFTIFAGVAIKAFKDVETEIINLRKVYGDFGTSDEEVDRVTAAVKELSREMSVLGFSAKETLGVAADAAALGFAGDQLLEVTRQASEFASLGMMTQTEALNSLVAVNSAFRVEVDQLGQSVDFLNAVENQTILSMQDMAEAIPITAAAIQGLGGDIKDLAVFMTAMREGGINANESANALKTSLARLITPTRQALETANEFGIALESIVANNEGDLMGMVQSLAGAMESLSDLQQQQLLSDLFGKRQFARMGALFNNLNREGSQAQKTIELTTMSMEDLAQVREKELGALKESPAMQLSKQLENIQLALAPIGEIFTQLLVDILGPLETVLNWFNSLEDGFKKFVAVGGAVVAVLIPAITMFVGLMGNLAGTMMNVIATLARWATGTSSFTTEQAEMAAQANATAVAENGLTNSLQQQAIALEALIAQYNRLNTARMPGGGAAPPLRMATGGRVPGSGNTDKIPALLTPGEFVVNKQQSQKNAGFLHALNNGSVKGFSGGGGTVETERTHTQKGRAFFFRSDRDSSEDVERVLSAREEELKITRDKLEQEKKITAEKLKQGEITEEEAKRSDESSRRRLERIDEEEKTIQKMRGDWAEVEHNVDQFGGTGTMGIENNQIAMMSKDLNQRIKSTATGVSGKEAAALIRETPNAYETLVSQSLYDDALEDDIEATVERTEASKRLTKRMAKKAEELPDDVSVVDDPNNTEAKGKVKALGELEVEAEEELLKEMRAEVDDMETAQAQGKKIDQDILAAKKRELAAQERLAEQREREVKVLAEARTGHADVGGQTQEQEENQKRYLKERRKQSSRREIQSQTVDAEGNVRLGRRQRIVEDATAAATPRARLGSRGRGYKELQYDTSLQAQLDAFTPEQQAALEAKAKAAGTSVANVYARALRDGYDEALAAGDYLGDGAIQGMKNATEQNSPSEAAARVGDGVDDGLAQGLRRSQGEVKAAATQVGEQLELDLDMATDGEQVGRDTAQEMKQGLQQADAKNLPGQNKRRMQGSQMAQMGIGMGVSALSTLPMMTGQDSIMGVSSEFTMGVGMATGQIAAFASMLPVGGAAVAGLAAAAGVAAFALEALKQKLHKTVDEATEFGASLGGAADAARKMSDVFGKATAIQKQNNIKLSENEQETADEFAAALGSEGGKALVEELKGLAGSERIDATAQYIESAVVNGMLEADQASTFAKVLANEIGDTRLANQVELRNAAQKDLENRTQRAQSIAEKRDRAIREDGTINRQGTKGQATTMAAAMAALQDWTTVAAVAKDEYAEGIISYQEYISALNDATEAQATYSDMLRGSISLGDNAYLTAKALDNVLRDVGIAEETRNAAYNEFRSGAIASFDDQGKFVTDNKVASFVDEQFSNILGDANQELKDLIGIEPFVDPGSSKLGAMTLNPFSGVEKIATSDIVSQNELEEQQNKASQMYAELIGITGDEATARQLTLTLMDEQNQITKLYNATYDKTNDITASLNASLAAINAQAENGISFGGDPGLQESFASGFAKKSNAELYANLLQSGQTTEMQANQLKYASSGVSYISGGENGPAGERVVQVEDGFKGKNADMYRDQYSKRNGIYC